MSSDDKLIFEEQDDTWQIRDTVNGNVRRSPMDSGEQDGDIAYLARSVRRPGVTQNFISVAGVHARRIRRRCPLLVQQEKVAAVASPYTEQELLRSHRMRLPKAPVENHTLSYHRIGDK